MLGKGGSLANDGFRHGFVGLYSAIQDDLSLHAKSGEKAFREWCIQRLLHEPKMTRSGAAIRAGYLWAIAQGIDVGDTVISSGPDGRYRLGTITNPYSNHPNEHICHRRTVAWSNVYIPRNEMSPLLRGRVCQPHTVVDVSEYAAEIAELAGSPKPANEIQQAPRGIDGRANGTDSAAFTMEKHLEDFLVANWLQTELGHEWTILEEDGDTVGQQFPTDSGPIDILAISRDRSRFLVVELKRGRASDVVIGQVLRYMGCVQSDIAEPQQSVEGLIVALEDDFRLRRALQMVSGVRFMRYEVRFRLVESDAETTGTER